MIVAIHQPNYLPWLGYFYKIYASDAFVFYDVAEFSKASYTKRSKIRKDKSSSETTWLSVPVHQHQTGAQISDILISERSGWAMKHLHKIANTYSSTRFFEVYYEWLRQILMQVEAQKTLADCNILLIRQIAQRLSLKATFHRSSEMHLSGKGSGMNLSIAQHLGAT
ncbi:MAG TPA: WbqC family protein, partial [Saprospiraceae bacterium]|nr:WbqC family protein [Saprospiraceae bacterium]